MSNELYAALLRFVSEPAAQSTSSATTEPEEPPQLLLPSSLSAIIIALDANIVRIEPGPLHRSGALHRLQAQDCSGRVHVLDQIKGFNAGHVTSHPRADWNDRITGGDGCWKLELRPDQGVGAPRPLHPIVGRSAQI